MDTQKDRPPIKGRGAQQNTPNRFLRQHRDTTHWEAIDEELGPPPPTEYRMEYPKVIVNKVSSPDVGMMYSLNPYQGCEHGCIYCYARPTHEYWGLSAGLDFERIVLVKPHAPELLTAFLQQPRWVPAPIALSGNTDPYQPAERSFGLTRKLLERFWAHRHPVSIITKNALILRDSDLLAQLAAHRLVHAAITVTALDESLRQKLEPRTVPYARRLEVIRRLTALGVPVTVMVAPIIPGLTVPEVPRVLAAAAAAGATRAGYTLLRLNGSVAPLFQDWVRKSYPHRAGKILHQVAECHGGQLGDSRFGTRMVGEGKLAESIAQLFRSARKRYFPETIYPAFDIQQFRRDPSAPTLFDT